MNDFFSKNIDFLFPDQLGQVKNMYLYQNEKKYAYGTSNILGVIHDRYRVRPNN